MTAAPPEPSDPKDMATTDKKPKGVEVFVRLEETSKEHRFALRCTLPSRWLGRKSLRSLLDTFFDAYERARPSAPHARRDAALWGDASRSQLDLDALLSEDLGVEKTLWVRFSSSPEFFGTPKTFFVFCFCFLRKKKKCPRSRPTVRETHRCVFLVQPMKKLIKT